MSRGAFVAAFRCAIAVVIAAAVAKAAFAQSEERNAKVSTGKAAEHYRPKAGHWEGEPSVSFEVTLDGDISNFKMNPWIATTKCMIAINALPIARDGTFGIKQYLPEKDYWLPENLTSEERNAKKAELKAKAGYWPDTITMESEVQVEVQRITGRFESADTVAGKFRILACGNMQWFWVKKIFDEMNTWQATWKGPKSPAN